MLSPGSRATVLVVLALVGVCSCGGDRHAGADTFWSGGKLDVSAPDEDPAVKNKSRKPFGGPDEFSGDSAAGAAASPAEKVSAWVGVRHDLSLAPSRSPKERCSCLDVEVGKPRDRKFQWAAGAPDIGEGALAIALSARGVPCPGGNANEEKRRASISAVDQEGNDVIVEVEELPDGRPLAAGAVIPKPGAGGSIYVKGRTPTIPYARAAGGRCKVF